VTSPPPGAPREGFCLLRSFVCDCSSVLLDVERRLGSLPVRGVPATTGPLCLVDRGSFSLEARALFECSLPLDLPSCRLAIDSLGFLVPSTMTPGLAPYETDCPTPPRFRSQAFSTSQRFPGTPELRGLVSCHNRSWDPPFRAFPSQRSRTSLEAAGSLAVIHRRAVARWTSPFAGRFPDVHARARLPGSPIDYGLPFRVPRLAFRLSRAWLNGLAPFRQLHLLRSFVPPVRPYLRL
jgi:hypothetical protein